MEQLVKTATRIGELLVANGQTVTTAESCTGGGISYVLTEVAGSSAWFERAFVTYSNDAKQELVGVNNQTLLTYGAVSEDVVAEMATGARDAANADFGLAVSGIAGPTGGSDDKPVGMVCFGWATKAGVVTETCLFDGDRHTIRRNTIAHSLCRLLSYLEGKK
ncbi:CinA family protein [Enterovibrio nigricans]|uniref:Nicotinamide-nucleotide amidase n=1 Tax=Enterovibrio nigricans DSM 22720 TaxID=1121868 RepID=A0A1T4U006_9GAMM|nr:nicotinamide-nucleotide amidohydrolase family protein [Enterovibrio nigricans]PKF51683.1 damage-inducible protein CinA [Enterovibrio nigricans]SKA45819.1 nicotinamide-nucleotide amidase [Enterovibrio nigricans DSM 22720]